MNSWNAPVKTSQTIFVTIQRRIRQTKVTHSCVYLNELSHLLGTPLRCPVNSICRIHFCPEILEFVSIPEAQRYLTSPSIPASAKATLAAFLKAVTIAFRIDRKVPSCSFSLAFVKGLVSLGLGTPCPCRNYFRHRTSSSKELREGGTSIC
ncbi:hypothetical protein TNIN_111081 [Trichonephila inaurata madagascariensis]|uniref:Uncharacterized protein n=1 Tax=Trichonephila inaurata madagascariensis TaxID=2747483 RepID=A0A8X7C0J1_9ARAC|nr:hypothetical protein TNIN_111081 [Trichonephila inaurata madagascariensis]